MASYHSSAGSQRSYCSAWPPPELPPEEDAGFELPELPELLEEDDFFFRRLLLEEDEVDCSSPPSNRPMKLSARLPASETRRLTFRSRFDKPLSVLAQPARLNNARQTRR